MESPVEEIVHAAQRSARIRPKTNYADDDECLKQAKDMKVGTWVEFTDAEQRAKGARQALLDQPDQLEIPVRQPQGPQGLGQDVFALAAEIRRGQRSILEEVPLFDRALDAIVERLKAPQHVGISRAAARKAGPNLTARRRHARTRVP